MTFYNVEATAHTLEVKEQLVSWEWRWNIEQQYFSSAASVNFLWEYPILGLPDNTIFVPQWLPDPTYQYCMPLFKPFQAHLLYTLYACTVPASDLPLLSSLPIFKPLPQVFLALWKDHSLSRYGTIVSSLFTLLTSPKCHCESLPHCNSNTSAFSDTTCYSS